MKSVPDIPKWTSDEKAERAFTRPRRILLLADVVAACAALVLALIALRTRHSGSTQLGVTMTMAGIILLVFFGLQLRAGSYTTNERLAPLPLVGTLVRDLIIGTAVATLLNYLTKGFFTGWTTASRMAISIFLESLFVVGLAARIGLVIYQRRQFLRGKATHRVLVLGIGPAADDFLRFIRHRPSLGIVVAGRLSYGAQSSAQSAVGPSTSPEALPVAELEDGFEGLKTLDRALRESGAAEVVVALDPEDQVQLQKAAGLLALAHVPFKVVPSLFEQSYRATELLGFAELPVIDVEVDALDAMARFWKRVMDLCVAGGAFLLLLPLELLIALAILTETGLPIIYRQQRVGKNGRRFSMLKFRTMVKDADQRLKDLVAANEADSAGRMFKMRDDPRLTRVGRFLRKWSLDELPQFINVLRHDMSMVGPRPPLPAEVERYEEEHLYRLKALPGVTGLWQTSGRSDLGFEDMVRLDRYYLDHWSLGLDLGILVKTVWVVLTRRGAR
jgi:exopolysaccharide biosynthesis polyprenyl glycosylphosphotransferase